MNADQDQRVRAAVRAVADAVPVVPPPAATIRARSRRRHVGLGGRWLAPALAAAAVVALIALAAVVPGLSRQDAPPGPTAADGGPVLPARVAGPSWLTASVADSPPGPAIAVVHYRSGSSQAELLVVGTDGRTYRRLDRTTALELSTNRAHSFFDVLLSPDGSHLAGDGGYVIDLATAEGDWYPIVEGDSREAWAHQRVLAWSADGRRLAYAVAADDVPRPPDNAATGEAVAVLDLPTGAVQVVDSDSSGTRAAFSPDASELAVYTEAGGDAVPPRSEVKVFNLDGKLLRVLPVPAGHRLVTGPAWSPNGELLLVAGVDDTDPRVRTYAFVDATGSGRAVPPPIRFQHDDLVLLGWQSSSTMLVGLDDGTARGPNLVTEVPLDGSPMRIVSRLSVDAGGLVHGLQLASGLVADADIRDAGPPRHGPWPLWLRATVGAVGALALLAAVVAWRMRRIQARRRPGS
jgi:WD40 repeat protein